MREEEIIYPLLHLRLLQFAWRPRESGVPILLLLACFATSCLPPVGFIWVVCGGAEIGGLDTVARGGGVQDILRG